MKESLEIAKKELIERWIKAFDEIDDFSLYDKNTVTVKYASTFRFHLKTYNKGKLKSGGKLIEKKPDGDCYEYGLDKNNFPTVCRFRHAWNNIDWIGFYDKEEKLVEYVEFCLITKTPSFIERIVFKNRKKILYQSFLINGRGTGFNQSYLTLSRPELAKQIIQDNHSVNCNVEEYEYNGNRIIKANGFFISPGIGKYTYEDAYSYDDNSSLNKIERFTENWSPKIIYLKPSGRTIGKLIDDLSKLLADEIIDALYKSKINEMIFNIQLNYHDVDSYWPYITIITQQEKEVAEANETESLFLNHIPIANEMLINGRSDQLNEMFAEFNQYIFSKKAWRKGSELLIKTSQLMTKNKLNGNVPVSDDFIVFATDWSMEEDIEKILLKCGAHKAKVEEWRKLNWF